jgi:hypothetical protein
LNSLGFIWSRLDSLGLARPHWISLGEKGKAVRGKKERGKWRDPHFWPDLTRHTRGIEYVDGASNMSN